MYAPIPHRLRCLQVSGENIQHYLQRHYIDAMGQVAAALRDCPNVVVRLPLPCQHTPHTAYCTLYTAAPAAYGQVRLPLPFTFTFPVSVRPVCPLYCTWYTALCTLYIAQYIVYGSTGDLRGLV